MGEMATVHGCARVSIMRWDIQWQLVTLSNDIDYGNKTWNYSQNESHASSSRTPPSPLDRQPQGSLVPVSQ